MGVIATKYEMWLTYNSEKEKIQLPVLPETFSVQNSSNNTSMNIVGLGEVVIVQDRPALQFSWSSFFPAATFPGIQVSSVTSPLTLIDKINTWKQSTTPVHLICSAMNISIYCTIENFQYSEDGGDPGTYQYNITLKEYQEYSTRQVTVDVKTTVASVQTTSTRTDSSSSPQTYTVKSGDCLWNIAKKYYGSGTKWEYIYNANEDLIKSTAKKYGQTATKSQPWIYAGEVLTIPSI